MKIKTTILMLGSWILSSSLFAQEGEIVKTKPNFYENLSAFYIIIGVSTLIGVLVNLTPIKPFQMLYYTAVLNGVAAPPLLFLIMLISNNKEVMGKYTNSPFSNIVGWAITTIMTLCAIFLLGMLL